MEKKDLINELEKEKVALEKKLQQVNEKLAVFNTLEVKQ